ncbi:MAG: xanthine dehydrogenase family protein molybdopterin-binding subunit [Acidobacteria bacterium]|nr:xanthine dehydrogenase family protein molybdopterin-binding subunit [Acidobacteriota bacterium]
MVDYSWPPMNKRRVIGQRLNRLDGPAKSSGKAKYPTDVQRPGLLHAVILSSPHAHARVRSIDISAAQAMPGVEDIRVMSPAGTEIQWAGAEVAAIAARTEEIARDAARAIKVDYEVLPHLVKEDDLARAGNRAKAAGEQVTGDPDTVFRESGVVVHEGSYSIPVITHCCLEPHGSTIEYKGEKVEMWPSTQNVSGIGGDLARSLNIPVTNVSVHMDYMGGGFGSKFPADRWGTEGANMSKKTGKAVKLYLDRRQELTIGGVRPSAFAKVKIAARRDGTIVAWQSESWATGGVGGGGMPPIPYVFTNIPNKRLNHSAVSLNAGGARAWRAPNHAQACALTATAMEDLAAKLNMDSLEFMLKNANLTLRPETYRAQLQKAAELIEWKKYAHQRGDKTAGHIKQGLGIGFSTWGGAGHASNCRANIHPDGSVEVELGSQDIGTATRTAIAMVAAETLGIPVEQVKVKIGENSYPASGASGGSTTIGGVSSSTRKAAMNALDKLMDVVAASLNVPKDNLEAVDQRIQVKGNPDKAMTFKAACQKLGVKSISEMGTNDPKNPGGLNSQGASGVQMAHVSVDIETGVVRMNKFVAVQDCGLVVNPKTAESQVYGACIMNICAGLMEERVMDQITGRVLNADMEFYKLAGIKDIGEIVVHMDITPEHDRKGIIGLGEPPAIAGPAAISNAVANAIGVRVPGLPMTPERVLKALYGERSLA